jgi:hypothetical protein
MAQENGFYIDLSRKPEGMYYDWKRLDRCGKPAYVVKGPWTPVPATRHPEFSVPGPHIKVYGLTLTESRVRPSWDGLGL